ncbi:unnamed protein product [Musa acuminata subsp. burmannicoides]
MSSSSGFIPSGSSQSKYRSWARVSFIVASANAAPGHILRPPPNGKYWKSDPLKSTLPSSNLSGMKLSAASQCRGSLPIAHASMQTFVPALISYPSTSPVCYQECSSRGYGGCSLSVSLMTHLSFDMA